MMKHFKQNLINTLKSFIAVTALAAFTMTHADDTEVFATVNIANNMLFVLDVSGSMRNKVVTVTTSSGTTTSNGTSGSVGGTDGLAVAQSQDDATQQLGAVADASAGAQTVFGNHLDFQPDNIVATRFRFDKGTIPYIGQRDPRYVKKAQAKVSEVRIKHAYLSFRAWSSDTDNTDIDIYIENDAAQYAYDNYYYNFSYYYWDYYNNYYHTDFPKIEQRPSYGPLRWNPQNWNTGSDYTTIDVASLVQQVVNLPDWDKTIHHRDYVSSLAFKFKTLNGARHAYSYDGASYWSQVPHLDIEYDYDVEYRTKERVNHKWKWVNHTDTYVSGNGYFPGEVHAVTRTRYDDAEQAWVNATPQTSYTESQWAFNPDQLIGVRFNLNSGNKIPKNSTINRAYIQFTSASDASADARINIQVEDTGFAQDYQTHPDIFSRSYDQNTQKTWMPPAWSAGEKNDNEKTPDLTQMVQHVVDRSDWDNALAFRFFGETGDRIAYAMDSGNPPVLHIEYQDIGGATTGTSTGGGGVVTTTRVEKRIVLMQEALREVLESAPNVNVGLMKYSGMEENGSFDHNENTRNHFVGGVLFPVSPIYEKASDYIGAFSSRDNLPDPANKTVREYVADVADQWEPEGGTPIVDALYEAALYYRGEQMYYGKNKNNGGDTYSSPGSNPSTYFGGAEITDDVRDVGRSSITNARYISPIKNECQSNYIVLMSDGAPTYYYRNSGHWGQSEGPFASTLKGSAVSELASAIPSCLTGNGENTDTSVKRLTAGTCGREITQYLAKEDQMPDAGRGANQGVKEKQTVKTFTIGFGQGLEDGAEEYLRSLATVDGQGYYTADNKEQLKDAFQKIFDTVAKAKGSLSSPGYSVNVKSGLEHEDDIYIPVFDRKNTSRWSGNLKKFKLVDDNGKRKIRGKNNKDAVDELGGFTDDTKDYWSKNSGADGLDIQKGGAAELIDPEGRKVYTDVGCGGTACDLNTHKLETANTTITSALLGIDNQGLSDVAKANRRDRLINFARGWEEGFYDANATPHGVKRHYMGDMLHSEPLVITYKKGATDGTGKKQYIFAGTNEGYLHAFDTATGIEKFAFMPGEFLKIQDDLLKNEGTYRDHKYGVDGVLSYWHQDTNKNKEVDPGEKVYLYFGLRRGGRAYYALDITNVDSPKLLWSVKGEGNIDNTNSAWGSLGQTWSAPYLARVGLSDGAKKEVVMFTGGYDPVEDRDKAGGRKELDSSTKSVATKMGNNIYILDAKTGERLWSLRESMGNTQIDDSLPGGFRMLDVNRNGLVDRLYFADTGGHIWRLDLSEKLSLSGDDKSKLTEFAFLGGSGANSRKFYNEPDVAMMRPNGKTLFAVSIGSGFRAHPNDKVIDDKMFVLRDVSPYGPLPNDFAKITIDKLATVSITSTLDTISLTQSGFGDEGKDKGWYLSLPDGEKVLATAVTFDGVITFTTMVPQILTHGVDPCKAPKSFGRLYALNILTGDVHLDLDEDDTVDDNDAYIDVVKGEIPGKPQIIFNKFTKKVISTDTGSGEVTKTSCSHPVDIRVGKKRSQVTGYDACRLESVYWSDPEND